MSNNSQTLLDIFQEILAASGNSSINGNTVNETHIISTLRENAARNVYDLEATLVKMMKDAKRLNITLKPDTCGYCEGGLRDVIETYNGIHGYVSLVVSTNHITLSVPFIVFITGEIGRKDSNAYFATILFFFYQTSPGTSVL